jgi:translocation and assembly module TamB
VAVPGWLVDDIGPIPCPIDISGKKASFNAVRAPLGATSALVRADFIAQNWLPQMFDIQASIGPQYPTPVDARVAGVEVKGNAGCELRIAGDGNGILITGAVILNRTNVTLAGGGQGGGGYSPDLRVNIGVRTGMDVEFLWPSSDLPLVTGVAAPNGQLAVQYDGPREDFLVRGVINVRGGKVFYSKNSFNLRDGRIEFNESPRGFDPRVTMNAEMLSFFEKKRLTITINYVSTPLSELLASRPRLVSDPSIAEAALWAILGENISGGDAGSALGNVASAATEVGNLILFAPYERQVRDTLGLDLFSMQTQFAQNVFTTLVAGGNPFTSGIWSFLDNTSVVMGKYIGNDMFFQTVLQLTGSGDPTAPMGGLLLKPEFALDMQTPLFDLSWSLVPEHPENLWLTDNRFTLSWKQSF